MIHSRILIFICSILLIVTCGCATSGKSYVAKGEELLAGNPAVITSVNQLQYQPIALDDSTSFAFDEQAAVVQEGSGRFFAKGFALPGENAPYSITVISYGMGTIDDPAIMYPEVSLLDDQYRVVRVIPSSGFAFRPTQNGNRLSTVIFINDNKPDVRYLLITNRLMADNDLIMSQSNITNVRSIYLGSGAVFYFPTGTSTAPLKVKASAIGNVEVQLQKYRLKKVGE